MSLTDREEPKSRDSSPRDDESNLVKSKGKSGARPGPSSDEDDSEYFTVVEVRSSTSLAQKMNRWWLSFYEFWYRSLWIVVFRYVSPKRFCRTVLPAAVKSHIWLWKSPTSPNQSTRCTTLRTAPTADLTSQEQENRLTGDRLSLLANGASPVRLATSPVF